MQKATGETLEGVFEAGEIVQIMPAEHDKPGKQSKPDERSPA